MISTDLDLLRPEVPQPVDADACEVESSDRAKVERLKADFDDIADLANLFKALADETRLKIVHALTHAELCTCEAAELVGLTPATVSHHLRLLKLFGLVRSRREGRNVWYRLDDGHVARLVQIGLIHVQERNPVR